MAFNLMSQAESKINSTIGNLKNDLPGGKIPEASSLAGLKGTLPNINTLKGVFASEEDLLTNTGIPRVKLKLPKIGLKTRDVSLNMFDETEPKIEEEVDITGLTPEQIAEETRKKEIRNSRG